MSISSSSKVGISSILGVADVSLAKVYMFHGVSPVRIPSIVEEFRAIGIQCCGM